MKRPCQDANEESTKRAKPIPGVVNAVDAVDAVNLLCAGPQEWTEALRSLLSQPIPDTSVATLAASWTNWVHLLRQETTKGLVVDVLCHLADKYNVFVDLTKDEVAQFAWMFIDAPIALPSSIPKLLLLYLPRIENFQKGSLHVLFEDEVVRRCFERLKLQMPCASTTLLLLDTVWNLSKTFLIETWYFDVLGDCLNLGDCCTAARLLQRMVDSNQQVVDDPSTLLSKLVSFARNKRPANRASKRHVVNAIGSVIEEYEHLETEFVQAMDGVDFLCTVLQEPRVTTKAKEAVISVLNLLTPALNPFNNKQKVVLLNMLASCREAEDWELRGYLLESVAKHNPKESDWADLALEVCCQTLDRLKTCKSAANSSAESIVRGALSELARDPKYAATIIHKGYSSALQL